MPQNPLEVALKTQRFFGSSSIFKKICFVADKNRILGPARGQPDIRGDRDPLLGPPLPLLTRLSLHWWRPHHPSPSGGKHNSLERVLKETHAQGFFFVLAVTSIFALVCKSKPLSARQREVKTVDILIVLFEGVDREKGRVVGRAGF
jgi:hypothetical protein